MVECLWFAYGSAIEDVSSIKLQYAKSSFYEETAGVPDVMLRQLNELAEGRGNHAEFARKREVLCSFPILYKTFIETGSLRQPKK